MRDETLPIADVTVIELGHIVAGPFCGMLLADLGADVVKVEHPGGGDMLRDSSELGNSTFDYLNRNKSSVTIDLKSAEGSAVFERLVAEADVVIENFGPGATDRLGIGYDDLADDHEGLVYCSIKGFTPGPYEEYPALDPIAESLSGLMSVTGRVDMPPVRVGTSIADMAAAMYGVIAILGALRQRERTGAGRHLHSGLFESTVALMGYWLSYTETYGKIPEPLGASHLNWAPYEVFRGADGTWVFIGPAGQDQWERMCHSLDLGDLVEDPRYATLDDRRLHNDELIETLQERLGGYTSTELVERLREVDVPVAPVNDVGEVLEDPHLDEIGLLATMPSTEGGAGDIRVPRYPVFTDDGTDAPVRAPPALGEHTEEVLSTLGYDDDEIESLRSADAI